MKEISPNNNQQKKKIFRSFEEYKREFFPSSVKNEIKKPNDPYFFGVDLARESLKQIENQLNKY